MTEQFERRRFQPMPEINAPPDPLFAECAALRAVVNDAAAMLKAKVAEWEPEPCPESWG